MLNKLLAEFTKSRPCRATDNALVEGKNGAVVRKHMGYGLIGSEWAGQIHRFYAESFNPYLNFHRPCGFATIEVNQRGKRHRHYRPTTTARRTRNSVAAGMEEVSQARRHGLVAERAANTATPKRQTHAEARSPCSPRRAHQSRRPRGSLHIKRGEGAQAPPPRPTPHSPAEHDPSKGEA
jgi:hypothetical protein